MFCATYYLKCSLKKKSFMSIKLQSQCSLFIITFYFIKLKFHRLVYSYKVKQHHYTLHHNCINIWKTRVCNQYVCMHVHPMSTTHDPHFLLCCIIEWLEFLFLLPAEPSIVAQYVAISVYSQQSVSCNPVFFQPGLVVLFFKKALSIGPGQPHLWIRSPAKNKTNPD